MFGRNTKCLLFSHQIMNAVIEVSYQRSYQSVIALSIGVPICMVLNIHKDYLGVVAAQ